MVRKLRYVKQNCSFAPRVGGLPPSGQTLEIQDINHLYFGTFPISGHEQFEFSVFHCLDPKAFEPDETGWIFEHRNTILSPSGLIWATVHPISDGCCTNSGTYELLSLIDVEDESCFISNQLGGEPECVLDYLSELFESLKTLGYSQLLQLDNWRIWRLKDDPLIDWSSNPKHWPWDGGCGMFHVFAHDPLDASTYRFVIQQ